MAKNATGHKNVIFVGLMLGMLVAAVSQTIVSPAMPVIVSELGGIEHYSWIATSALLASAVTVPVIGKLSDIYGRRGFYIAGIVVFMLGSVLAGAAQGFWWLVAARAVQGFGMGTIMPLSDHHRRHHKRPRARKVHGRRLRGRLERGATGRGLDHRQLLLAVALLREPAFRRRGARLRRRLSPHSAHAQEAQAGLRRLRRPSARASRGTARNHLGRHHLPVELLADRLAVRCRRAHPDRVPYQRVPHRGAGAALEALEELRLHPLEHL